jgi:hypothetical protein
MWLFQREGIVVLPHTNSSGKEEFKIKQEVGNKIEYITQKNSIGVVRFRNVLKMKAAFIQIINICTKNFSLDISL